MTITTSSTSGNLASYTLQSWTGGADILKKKKVEEDLFEKSEEEEDFVVD